MQREQILELLFETFEVPAVFVGRASSLAAFSAGRSTALVCECSGASTSVVPVLDGFILHKATRRSSRGGIWLTERLEQVLARSAGDIVVRPRYATRRGGRVCGTVGVDAADVFAGTHPSYERYYKLDVVREMKEEVCALARLKLDKREIAALIPPGQAYELPDGTRVEVTPDMFSLPEFLLEPQVDDASLPQPPAGASAEPPAVPGAEEVQDMGAAIDAVASHVPLPKMLHDALSNCDPDIRKDMLQNILLTGGGSLFSGLPERLHRELSALLPTAMKPRIIAASPVERRFSTWIGGSILASLGSFQQLWLSRAEFLEGGASLAEQRFPG